MNKTALIVGGSGGIGSCLVQQFYEAGYQVIFTYHKNKEAARMLENQYGAVPYQLDPTHEESVEKIKVYLASNYSSLNAFVYAAGIFEDALVDNMELSSWNQVLSVNLTGAFLTTRYLLPLLRKSGNGRILYIGSVMGDAGCYGSCGYSAAKAGLIALAKSVALENAKKNVTANVLSYGYIDAGMTAQVSENILDSAIRKIPMKRLGNASDAAKIAVDLCAEHMNYASGQVVRVNGALYV